MAGAAQSSILPSSAYLDTSTLPVLAISAAAGALPKSPIARRSARRTIDRAKREVGSGLREENAWSLAVQVRERGGMKIIWPSTVARRPQFLTELVTLPRHGTCQTDKETGQDAVTRSVESFGEPTSCLPSLAIFSCSRCCWPLP